MNRLMVLVLVLGCAHSSKKMYGELARYDRGERAWVVHQDSTWHLRNPVTGCVLRCRADVERYAALNAAASHAANQRSAATNTGMVATLPLSVPAAILILPAIGISSAVDGPKTKERVAKGDEARARKAYDEAIDWYSLAIFEGDKSAGVSLAEVLVLAGREDAAAEVDRMLVCCGANLGADKWHDLEEFLASRGTPVSRCDDESKEPLSFRWED